MALINSLVKKPNFEQSINSLPVRLSVSIAQLNEDVSGIHQISDSFTPECGEMVHLNTVVIGTPSGNSAS
jgi:hypothetical protein